MNVSQAIELAGSFYIPDFLLADGTTAVEGERAKTEEAIRLLREAWFEEPSGAESFSFDLVRELADRNRRLCDLIECSDDPAAQQLAKRRRDSSGLNLSRALSLDDLVAGVAALQKRSAKKVARIVAQNPDNLAVAYVDAPIKATVLGIDIETTGRHPDRSYVINVGWELMELSPDTQPYQSEAVWSGLPPVWEGHPIPLEEVHHITPEMLVGKTPFREDKELQQRLLKLLCKYPYLAHNAAFEDSWFLLHLDGYAEARKAGKIIPIDTRDICRRVDKDTIGLPHDSHPNALENWARRRGTLSSDESERHLGLDDTDLMLRTVQAEFVLRNMFGTSANTAMADAGTTTSNAEVSPAEVQVSKPAAQDSTPAHKARGKHAAKLVQVDRECRTQAIDTLAQALVPLLAAVAYQGQDALAAWARDWIVRAAQELPEDLVGQLHVGDPDAQGFVATLVGGSKAPETCTYQARLSVVDQGALARALASFAADLAEVVITGAPLAYTSLLACFR